jgi:hypothetical protein
MIPIININKLKTNIPIVYDDTELNILHKRHLIYKDWYKKTGGFTTLKRYNSDYVHNEYESHALLPINTHSSEYHTIFIREHYEKSKLNGKFWNLFKINPFEDDFEVQNFSDYDIIRKYHDSNNIYLKYLDVTELVNTFGTYHFEYLYLRNDKMIIDILRRNGYTVDFKMRGSTCYEFDKFFDFYDNIFEISRKKPN